MKYPPAKALDVPLCNVDFKYGVPKAWAGRSKS